jgi:hypothetical protein
MLLQQQQQLLLRACVRARLPRSVIDTMYQLIYTRRRPRRGESNFRMAAPKLALLSVSILLEDFYTKIRFYTPHLSALLSLTGQIYLF